MVMVGILPVPCKVLPANTILGYQLHGSANAEKKLSDSFHSKFSSFIHLPSDPGVCYVDWLPPQPILSLEVFVILQRKNAKAITTEVPTE